MNYTIHDAAGRIISTGFCPDGMEMLQAQEGQLMTPIAAHLHLDYVVNGEAVRRPDNPATLSGNKISDIPPGATVSINRVDYVVDDGVAELDFTLPGTYSIVVTAFPYLPATFTVTK